MLICITVMLEWPSALPEYRSAIPQVQKQQQSRLYNREIYEKLDPSGVTKLNFERVQISGYI
jgi:hypothetical protein